MTTTMFSTEVGSCIAVRISVACLNAIPGYAWTSQSVGMLFAIFKFESAITTVFVPGCAFSPQDFFSSFGLKKCTIFLPVDGDSIAGESCSVVTSKMAWDLEVGVEAR